MVMIFINKLDYMKNIDFPENLYTVPFFLDRGSTMEESVLCTAVRSTRTDYYSFKGC